ncbi:hypothetical protein ZHAS_00018662 [Anopheles sinensis]|uniref:Uncharacterized protein n=1 Tax=Anopheles sinensis TaxID=74873 RepID=A0A084WK86_ANOSI|nr:hypothetical protein ZHAS_00018662 [Anopheles sinensis]
MQPTARTHGDRLFHRPSFGERPSEQPSRLSSSAMSFGDWRAKVGGFGDGGARPTNRPIWPGLGTVWGR